MLERQLVAIRLAAAERAAEPPAAFQAMQPRRSDRRQVLERRQAQPKEAL